MQIGGAEGGADGHVRSIATAGDQHAPDPGDVIARAREVLKVHERAETQQVREASPATAQMQMTMFTPLSQRIVDRLAEADVDGLTPRDALQLLAELQRELKGGL